ncbi:protein kinase dsk1 [Parachaetomium inaequale]|uniref:non-specific serine/threonine protein kinase n=1 Tax=Parachaetomium inaequale TaxID=2588326 RepID=A0AAN6PGC3_9PEZI|nr:protein kinase dsk1 [Parachaetomium inaequale]
MANNTERRPEKVYFPNIDVENLEGYMVGGYHPTVIGDSFHEGRYEIVHKLGFGGYSTIWLARDRHLQRYVSLKILIARQTSESNEAEMLRLLSDRSFESAHPGHRFVPRLLDDFTLDGPNGRHLCLEWSSNNMFPVETARSIAAQLILGLSYLHSRGVCHGDLHIHNFLIYGRNIDHLSPDELYTRYAFNTAPVRRVDGAPPEPHAPPYAVYSMPIETPANELADPTIKISDYGTSFVTTTTDNNPPPELCTPTLYLPPEVLFSDDRTVIMPLAADIWTFGVNLYEVLGERTLFETFTCDRDDILADVISTLGLPPQRWWDTWANCGEFFEEDSEWRKGGISRVYDPVWRPLRQRMWDMGRGETPERCEWDVRGGEMRALEELFRGVLAWEPKERWTAEDLVRSEYMVKWALPAWERQRRRQGEAALAPA